MMLYQYLIFVFTFLSCAISAPILDGASSGKLEIIAARQADGPHQVYVVNVDEQTEKLWMEMATGSSLDEYDLDFVGAPELPRYHTLTTAFGYMLNPPTSTWYNGNIYPVPHGKCRILYCEKNFGISLCSRRKGDQPQVGMSGHAIGLILREWLGAFINSRYEKRDKMDGGFTAPNFGRSYWSEDPTWSINLEECGSDFVDFEVGVLHDV